jgi:hypothetical protein
MPVSIPKRRPFKEHKMQPSKYFGGLFTRLGIRPMISARFRVYWGSTFGFKVLK